MQLKPEIFKPPSESRKPYRWLGCYSPDPTSPRQIKPSFVSHDTIENEWLVGYQTAYRFCRSRKASYKILKLDYGRYPLARKAPRSSPRTGSDIVAVRDNLRPAFPLRILTAGCGARARLAIDENFHRQEPGASR
jgi:hypothetical protein